MQTFENPSKKRIESLQILRAISFIGIFLTHAMNAVYWSRLAVSIFFVLSGFLMTITNYDKKLELGVKKTILFGIKKIKKLYLLHILTMFAIIILKLPHIIHYGQEDFLEFFVSFILNIFLLQSWFPYSSICMSLNGVAWYLSTALFLYTIFPSLLTWVKIQSLSKLSICMLLVLVFQVITCIPFVIFCDFNSRVYFWYMYCFPIFRFGDFFAGCLLGVLFLREKLKFDLSNCLSSILEVTALLLTALILISLKQGYSSYFLQSVHNQTSLYIPISFLWVYLFIMNKGFLTRLLYIKPLLCLGNISAYMFLVHDVVIKYINRILRLFNIKFEGIIFYVQVLFMFVLSLVITFCYMKLERKILNNNNNL